MRLHRKVRLWWGRWWAVQLTLMWDEWSLGVRVNVQRPLLDLYFGGLTIALGRHAVYTDPRTRTWDSARGLLLPDHPHFPLDEQTRRELFGDPVEARVL